MARTKRPRIADVAKLAGVSEGTVSVVLNNRVGESVRVSEDTQQKIWVAVRELGYVANPVAQSLAGGQNRIIAVFTFESIFPIDSRNFYYPFLIGIEEEADTQGYDLLLVTGSNGATNGTRHIFQNGINRLNRADGAILLGHGERSEVLQLLEEQYPFVFVGRRDSPLDTISYIAADYSAATVELVHHLVQNGHQQIAYVRSTRDTEASQDRENGVRTAFSVYDVTQFDDYLWRGVANSFSVESFTHYLTRGYTAFVAEDDELGRQILAVAEKYGAQCPRDYSLVVLGNPLNPMIDVPNWTSFNIPRRDMGRESFKMLLDLLTQPEDERETPLRKTLSCVFYEGDTVRKL